MKRIISMLFATLGVAFATWPGPGVRAQDVDNFEVSAQETPEMIVYSGFGGIGIRTEADLDDGGRFDAAGFQVGGGGVVGFSDYLKLDAGASYNYDSYSFSGEGTEPWDDVQTFRARAMVRYIINETWRILGGPLLSYSGEDGADFDESFAGGVVGGFDYKLENENRIGLIVGLLSPIEDDAKFILFPLVDWKFEEPWSAHVGYTVLGPSGGPGAEVAYTASDQWRFSSGLQMQNRRFRLDDNGPAPGGVGEDKSVPLYVKATCKIVEGLSADAFLGLAVGGNLRVEDDHGDKVTDSDYDPSAVVGARVLYVY